MPNDAVAWSAESIFSSQLGNKFKGVMGGLCGSQGIIEKLSKQNRSLSIKTFLEKDSQVLQDQIKVSSIIY